MLSVTLDQHLKNIVLFPSCIHEFSWEIHCHSNCFHLHVKCHFSFTVFKTFFSLPLVYRNFIIICPSVDLFGFILFEANSAVCSYKFVCFCQIWKFSAIISSSISWFPPFLSLLDSNGMYIGNFTWFHRISSLFFFALVYSLFRLGNFYCSFFKFNNSFPFSLHLVPSLSF